MTRLEISNDPFEKARRHSRRVRLLKTVLPIGAIVFAAVFIAAIYISSPGSLGFQLGSTSVENGRLVMQDPKLDGFTSDNRAYSMTASRASQLIGDGNRIDLEGIDARLPLDADDWITVTAETGTFDRAANRLEVTSPMRARTEKGIDARFQSASVDISSGTLETSDPVEIDLDGTRVSADSMQIIDDGTIMIFENRVRMRIEGDKLQSAATTNGVMQ
ncbi:LPS export ABC transporter periplasmic protein LptC [Aliihoeflea sp. PC F10.4]